MKRAILERLGAAIFGALIGVATALGWAHGSEPEPRLVLCPEQEVFQPYEIAEVIASPDFDRWAVEVRLKAPHCTAILPNAWDSLDLVAQVTPPWWSDGGPGPLQAYQFTQASPALHEWPEDLASTDRLQLILESEGVAELKARLEAGRVHVVLNRPATAEHIRSRTLVHYITLIQGVSSSDDE